MAGYSSTPLVRKLGVEDHHVVLLDGAPSDLALDLGGVVPLRRLPAAPRTLDVTLTFQTRAAALAARLPRLVERTAPAGMVWVCWPKKAAQRALGIVSDLDDNAVRTIGLGLAVVDVKVAAIDETWAGLKFVRRLADR